VVISSTASTEPILTYAQVQQAITTRRHRPMFMVDIAVPRDIESRAGELEDVYLYTVDDLNEVIQENLRSRAQAAQQAEEIIDNHVSHFMAWLQSRGAVDTIAAMRERSETLRAETLEKAMRLLQRGKTPEQALQFLAHTLTNKFLHEPCVQLRQAGYNGNDDVIIHARTLFQLPAPTSDKAGTD
jgi:glutamyl-tRNA reductase